MSAAIARASGSVAGGGELEVEGDERRAGADEHGAAARVGRARAEVGPDVAGRDALGELRQAADAQLGARAPAGEQAVEEDRQAGAPELLARDERRRAGGAAARVVEEDERRDVERADVRVAAALGAQVDVLLARAGARDERGHELRRVAGEREDAAVVVGVGVHVEQVRAGGGERRADPAR